MRPINKPKTTKHLSAAAGTKTTAHKIASAKWGQSSTRQQQCPVKRNRSTLDWRRTPSSRDTLIIWAHSDTRRKKKCTELAKHVWKLKRRNEQYQIKWTIFKRATSYSSNTEYCCLCLKGKLSNVEAKIKTTLNCKTELVSKCRHQKRFDISRFVPSVT